MKAFVFDPLWPGLLTESHKAVLKKAGAEIVLTTQDAPLTACKLLFEGDEPRVLAINPDYVGWSLPAEAYQGIPNLKAVITASTSYGWIGDAGIPIVNIRNFSTDAVAEWAVMMMLALARKVPLLIKNRFPLNFGSDFQTYQGVNLNGKKAGIIGLGHIGRAIAQRCAGLGMEVLYWNRTPKQTGFTPASLETIFSSCDVIFPALADNMQTQSLISDAILESLRPEAIVSSIVHKSYNHALLVKRAEAGAIYGYAFEDKAGAFGDYEGNIWAAPAYAWCTDGSLRQSMDLFVAAIADAAQNKFPNRVNA